jgi:hypothetical protein
MGHPPLVISGFLRFTSIKLAMFSKLRTKAPTFSTNQPIPHLFQRQQLHQRILLQILPQFGHLHIQVP